MSDGLGLGPMPYSDPGVTVVCHPEAQHYCDLPGWLRRRRLSVVIGTVVECQECGAHWQWRYRTWGDSGKEWVRHTG